MIKCNYQLDKLNTLSLSCQATYYAPLTNVNQLPQLAQYAKNFAVFVLGCGSNIILPEIYHGLIIHNQLLGINLLETVDDNSVLVKVMAGESWDNFVAYTLVHNWFGLENLSLIPGTVGASPIQNIGAYGVEVKEFIHCVEVYDIKTQQFIRLDNAQCQFKYRDSYLKHNPHLIVISVTFCLQRLARLNIKYADVAKELANLVNPIALDLRACVIKIRKAKLPDPAEISNVGSFFHNPVLTLAQVWQLQDKYPAIPVYPIDDTRAKVSAGWLVDNLGLKGYRLGNVGVYDKQALVLVNHGGATRDELLNLARFIQKSVWENYEIKLNIEPLIIDGVA